MTPIQAWDECYFPLVTLEARPLSDLEFSLKKRFPSIVYSFTAWAETGPIDPTRSSLVARGLIKDSVEDVGGELLILKRVMAFEKVFLEGWVDLQKRRQKFTAGYDGRIPRFFSAVQKKSSQIRSLHTLRKCINPLVATAALSASIQPLVQNASVTGGNVFAVLGILAATLGCIIIILDFLIDKLDNSIRKEQIKVATAEPSSSA